MKDCAIAGFIVSAIVIIVALVVGLLALNEHYIERTTGYVCSDEWGLRVVHVNYSFSDDEDEFYLMTADEFAEHCKQDGGAE